MSAVLRLVDEQTAADLRTFCARAAVVDREAAVRLQAQGTVLAAYVQVLAGSGLAADGLVLGLRTMRMAGPADLDTTVPLSALLDRFARDGDAGPSLDLAVPPTEVRVPWAGQGAPRAGWAPMGRVGGEELTETARRGIEEVARAVDPAPLDLAGSGPIGLAGLTGPGALDGSAEPLPRMRSGAVDADELRRRVWARPMAPADAAPIPAGMAFAAHVLGFVTAQPAAVLRCGRWTRLSTEVGHVLAR